MTEFRVTLCVMRHISSERNFYLCSGTRVSRKARDPVTAQPTARQVDRVYCDRKAMAVLARRLLWLRCTGSRSWGAAATAAPTLQQDLARLVRRFGNLAEGISRKLD